MATAQKNFRRMMKYLKSRDDIEITTYRSLVDIFSSQPEFVPAERLADMAAAALRTKALAPHGEHSPAETFAALARSLCDIAWRGIPPNIVVMGHPLGPLEMPPEQPEISRVKLEDVYGLAGKAVDAIDHTGALPAWLTVGNARIGTGSLFALFSAVYLDAGLAKLRPEYDVPAFEPYPRTNEAEIIKEVEGYKTWPVHRRDLDMSKIVEFTRLQLWTLKEATRF
jgi:hypothetical protein